MAVTSAVVLLAVIWFMVLFVVLPLKLKTQGDVGRIVPGTHASSPEGLNLKRKFVVTTIFALIIWTFICTVIVSGAISVRDIDWFSRMSPPGSADGTGG
jgi:predicted secreted protein